MNTFGWRPHTTQPGDELGEYSTALIATIARDLPAETERENLFVLDGIYTWRHGQWVHEGSGLVIQFDEYWWLPEIELLDAIELVKVPSAIAAEGAPT